MSENRYLFCSQRLGFRTWQKEDLDTFQKINADSAVMEYFPKALTREETADFIDRQIKHYQKYAYCYFAVEIRKTKEFAGFIGLAFQDYESTFNPAADIGWRLKKSLWGKGYATEGAKRCLEFGFEDLKLKRIVSVCTPNNARSEKVMQKIGMIVKGEFNHPQLDDYPDHQRCVWYEIQNH